jgi:hypothetical protein
MAPVHTHASPNSTVIESLLRFISPLRNEGDAVQRCIESVDANRFTRSDNRHAGPNHTPGANALLAPFLTLRLCPLPHGVYRPTQQRVPITSRPEWDSHTLE